MSKPIYLDLLPKSTYAKNGLVFHRKTKEYLGTVHEVITKRINRR